MYKIIVGGFHQETNSFNPVITTKESFDRNTVEGEALLSMCNHFSSMGGILTELSSMNVKIVPSIMKYAHSGGPVRWDVIQHTADFIVKTVIKNPDVNGVFLMMHGATQSPNCDDCCGYIIERIREALGPDGVIAIALDLHANVTSKMLDNADVLCAYRQYPHTDMVQTGVRAAKLGLECIEKPMKTVCTEIPMLLPANIYTTMEGPVKETMDYAREKQQKMGIKDFSICIVQPWLDVSECATTVLAVDDDVEKASAFVKDLSYSVFDLRKKVTTLLHTMDESLKIAANNTQPGPCVIADSADSVNAGATGDNAGVLKCILQAYPTLHAAIAIEDALAASKAHELGVGKQEVFNIGGTKDPASCKVESKAYVRTLHDGRLTFESDVMKGAQLSIGKCAVLSIGSVDVLVCEHLIASSDPQLYRCVGLEPRFYDVISVKACTSFRAAYKHFAAKILDTNTSGVASAELLKLPFVRIPRPLFPFDNINEFVPGEKVTITRKGNMHT